MGKIIKKNYRIVVLFLFVSVLSFSSGIRTRVEGIDSKNYKEIKINLMSITNNDVKSMKINDLREERNEVYNSYTSIQADKIELEDGSIVKIGGKNYTIRSNKTIRKVDGYNKVQYIYMWTGTYNTKFVEENREERRVSFSAERVLNFGRGSTHTVRNLSGKYIEPNKSVEMPSNQWIYSQITKTNLINSNKYTVNFYEDIETIKTIDEDRSLEELLKSSGGYSRLDYFNQQEQERYEYIGTSKSVIEFKLKGTSTKPKNGKFELTIEENNVLKRKINENYTIPVPITNFKEQDLEPYKNTFIYEDKYELENLKAYRCQEVVFRLYKGLKHDGIRPIKKIEENEMSNIDNNYIDFVFKNNGSSQEIEKEGMKGRFIEGKFELMGLEDQKSYKLDFYTLRYKDNGNRNNYVTVTYEKSLNFIGKSRSFTGNSIWLKDIDISDYKDVKLNMISMTTQDIKELEILKLIETRNNSVNIEAKKEEYMNIKTIKQSLKNIWIEGKEYSVINNKITLDDGSQKYVYKWDGIYTTKFILKEGKIRNLNIGTRGYFVKNENTEKEYLDTWLEGMYIEPIKAEEDKAFSHQWVMFEFNPTREFKAQNYKVEDRVLSPERKGYRRLKTINYEKTLVDFLYGEKEYMLENEFRYNDEAWSYQENNNPKGLIIEKTITESKGNLKGADGSELTFYTDKKGIGIEKLGEIGNKATFRWNKGPLNTNGDILSYDKVIFRIVKGSLIENNGNPKFYWDPYANVNPINYIDETTEGNNRLEEFLFGNKNYVDLVLDANTSKTITLNNAIISYEQTNKELRLIGLPVGDYTIQFYNVKRGHDGGYKVITYENQSEFKMDISDIAGPDFEKENNIHKIDFITVGEEQGDVQVNVNFITKMEREINLTVDNLKSRNFNIEEINEGTGKKEGIGESKILSLKESETKKFLFPLDVVFVIDNSGSMQNEINNVKNGLSDFGQKLLDRGFDVKYNLITFGPQQNRNYKNGWNYIVPTGNWKNKIAEYHDNSYMAIYKDKWFNGATLNKPSSRSNDLEELISAFDNINAIWGYNYGQENSAWGIHYAIEKLRENGRYLSYSGEIVEEKSKGYMPSEKMIIFLTDENMDQQNLPSEYRNKNVLEELSKELAGETFNNMPDIIDLNGIFHIRKDGNIAQGANKYLTRYDEVPGLGYRYTSGYNEKIERIYYSKKKWTDKGWIKRNEWDKYYKGNSEYRFEEYNRQWVYYSKLEWINQGSINQEEWVKNYEWNSDYRLDSIVNQGGKWIEYDDNEIPILGVIPSDIGEISHTDFKYYNAANNFFMYEMGSNGEYVNKALDLAIDNLGIIQRWELSYLTPFNKYDGTTRTIYFKLVNLVGRDGIKITRDIKNLNEEKDKQYTVKEEKLALEFKDPSGDNLKLSIVDGIGRITFRGKARYTDYNKNNQPIIIEDMIKEYKLDVLDNNNKLLLSRNTDNIEMSLSDEGWLENKVTKDNISKTLSKRKKSWVKVINNSNQDILNYIDKARYIVEGEKNYKIEFMSSEVEEINSKNLGKETSTTLALIVDGQVINIEKDDFEKIVENRSDTWYELKNTSEIPNLLDSLENNDFKKIKDGRYKIKLRDLGLKTLLSEIGENDEGIALKISNTKIVELSNLENSGDTFGDQGWYNFKIVLTDDEMTKLINSETIKLTEKINLEATIVTDLFNKTTILKDVDIDLSTPKIKNVKLNNKTLFNFLDTMYSIDKNKTFSIDQIKKNSGYDSEVGSDYVVTSNGSYVKNRDNIDLELIVEGKNIDEYDVAVGIGIDGWSNPKIEPYSNNNDNEIKKFKVIWNDEIFSKLKAKNIMANNQIKNQCGFLASQNIVVLNTDNEIKVSPTVKGVELIDNIYYVNSDYEIDLGNKSLDLKSGIAIFSYNKESSDKKDGNPNNYFSISENIFGGGESSNLIRVNLDNGETHSTDGEYVAEIYGMSRSGKLKGIDSYSSNFKEIMANNITNQNIEKIVIRVDTVNPKITNVLVEQSEEVLDEEYYYFDFSFDIEDFNSSNKKLKENVKGGYLLDIKANNTEILKEPDYENETPHYNIRVKKPEIPTGLITEITIKVEDKAGNQKEKIVKIIVPKDIKVNTYEEIYQKEKSNLIKDGYKFTKGGFGSNILNPAIYVTVPSSDSEDEERVGRLRVEKIDGDKIATKEISVPEGNSEKELEIIFDFKEGSNIVRVTPISITGVEGKFKELKFVVDTKINTSYLDTEDIISELEDKEIKIKLTKFKELSGLSKYNYILSNGIKIKNKEVVVVGEKYLIPTEDKNLEDVEIKLGDFSQGSRLTLLYIVYDNLGHKKTFEKTYFIPKESNGIISKVSGEVKQRKSKLKIVTNGIELESSIDMSSEDGNNSESVTNM